MRRLKLGVMAVVAIADARCGATMPATVGKRTVAESIRTRRPPNDANGDRRHRDITRELQAFGWAVVHQ